MLSGLPSVAPSRTASSCTECYSEKEASWQARKHQVRLATAWPMSGRVQQHLFVCAQCVSGLTVPRFPLVSDGDSDILSTMIARLSKPRFLYVVL
jgi:hypothetical protein